MPTTPHYDKTLELVREAIRLHPNLLEDLLEPVHLNQLVQHGEFKGENVRTDHIKFEYHDDGLYHGVTDDEKFEVWLTVKR